MDSLSVLRERCRRLHPSAVFRLDCCRRRGWPVALYTAEQLRAVPGAFSHSDFVEKAVGVGNVCERAAAASGGRIVAPRFAGNGVTVAVAEMEWGIDFDKD